MASASVEVYCALNLRVLVVGLPRVSRDKRYGTLGVGLERGNLVPHREQFRDGGREVDQVYLINNPHYALT